jgi:hypothetical protein
MNEFDVCFSSGRVQAERVTIEGRGIDQKGDTKRNTDDKKGLSDFDEGNSRKLFRNASFQSYRFLLPLLFGIPDPPLRTNDAMM